MIKKIIDDFCPMFTPGADCPMFTPGADLIYLGDAETKFTYFDKKAFQNLGLNLPDKHGKMPDVMVHYKKQNWVVIIEALTSHGPINTKRKIELENLYKGCRAGLVFVTAFLNRKDLLKYLSEIAWETEVWIADDPTHLTYVTQITKKCLFCHCEERSDEAISSGCLS